LDCHDLESLLHGGILVKLREGEGSVGTSDGLQSAFELWVLARIEVVLLPLGRDLHVLGIIGLVIEQEDGVRVARIRISEGSLQHLKMALVDSTSSQISAGQDHTLARDLRKRVILGDAMLRLLVHHEHLSFVHMGVCTGASRMINAFCSEQGESIGAREERL
jgi:hypothetical protein